MIVRVPVKDVQADEIWSFIQKKEKHCGPDDDPNFGDAYCFVAIERHSKLVLNFALGKRDLATTNIFIEGLRLATSTQNFQITTDGFGPYVSAIENTLSDRVDFAQLIKVYRASVAGEGRYSPAEVVSTEAVPVIGNPEPKRICTSHVERQNLSNENADSTLHQADEWLLQKIREPLGCALPLLRLLQLLPDSQHDPGHACDGSGHHGSRLGSGGTAHRLN